MQVDILTIFPNMFTGPLTESIVSRGLKKNLFQIKLHNLRDYTTDKRHTTDDRPYGGGPGMVMLIEPIDKALQAIKYQSSGRSKVILTAANGTPFTQSQAGDYAGLDQLIIIAGHYEGVDQRVADHLVDETISIGPYVLTGGELPAMVITDAVVRLLPGVLGDPASIVDESHKETGYSEYPHYTRPENYRGWPVPETLLSGHHAQIAAWRKEKSHNHSK